MREKTETRQDLTITFRKAGGDPVRLAGPYAFTKQHSHFLNISRVSWFLRIMLVIVTIFGGPWGNFDYENSILLVKFYRRMSVHLFGEIWLLVNASLIWLRLKFTSLPCWRCLITYIHSLRARVRVLNSWLIANSVINVLTYGQPKYKYTCVSAVFIQYKYTCVLLLPFSNNNNNNNENF